MKTITFAATLLFGGIMAMNAGQEPSVDDLLKQADAAFKKGENDQALKLAGQAIDKNPKFVPAYLYRAAMFAALHKHKDAVADYDQAIKLDPKVALAYQQRGEQNFKA